MSVRLGKDILHNLGKASEIEWLEKNKYDIYSSSTCIGMNTRREHGLFVVPDVTNKKKVVLLSKLEESVFIENKLHEISTNNYTGGIFPAGYTYLKSFKKSPFPVFKYDIEGRIIEKTVFLLSDRPLMIVRYELKNQGSPLNIIIKPFLADRYNTELTRELQGLNTDSYLGHQFVRWSLKVNMPEVYVYYSHGEFIPANLWYKNFSYPKDKEKYTDSLNEHLFNPGFFQATLNPYQSIDLYITNGEMVVSSLNYDALYREESVRRKNSIKPVFNQKDFDRAERTLLNSVRVFNSRPLITVSTLENIYTNRDIIFSIPGIYFATQNHDGFKKQFKALLDQLSQGLLPFHSPDMREQNHYSAADLSLWLINLGYLYYQESGDIKFFENEIYESFKNIIESYQKGTLNNIYVDKDNLVFSGNKSSSTSWIPLTNGNNEIYRYGKLLEINALWYNAVMIFAKFTELLYKKRKAEKFEKLAAKIKESFIKTFVKDDELIDFVNQTQKNADFRINQIIPISLPFSAIDNSLAKNVLLNVDKHLLTPYGLRSAKKEKANSVSVNVHRKTSAYYNGSVWPWTMQLYISAVFRYANKKEDMARKLNDYFRPLLKMLDGGMIDYLPEAVEVNGEPLHMGSIDFTPSLSSLLWSYYLIKREINSDLK